MDCWKLCAAGPYSATAAKPMKKPHVPMIRPARGLPCKPWPAASAKRVVPDEIRAELIARTIRLRRIATQIPMRLNDMRDGRAMAAR